MQTSNETLAGDHRILGPRPQSGTSSFGERLIAYRRQHGLSRSALAIILGADEATLWRWDINQRKPESEGHVEAVRQLKLF